VSREAGEAEGRRGRLHRLNRWAADVYHEMLVGSEEGKGARDYLASRGIGKEAVQAFHLGFAPNRWDFLYRQASRKGFDASDYLAVGLGLRGEKGTYDRFRGRLIFPIQDLQDRVVAFGGRVIGKAQQGQPKYMNSPETPVYVKSRHLYALNLARREIVRQGFAVLVEGYTDVIGLWQAGIRNVAATLGTALGEEHLRLLSRLTERIVLAFDADAAGIGASERGLEYFDRFNLDLRVMELDEGMDPADFVARHGAEEFLRRAAESMPLVDFCLDKVLSEHDPDDTNARVRGVRKAVYLVSGLGGDIDHERYVRRIADWAGTGYQAVYGLYQRSRPGGAVAEGAELSQSRIALPPQVRAEREMLRLVMRHPFLLPRVKEEIDGELFTDRTSRVIFQALLEKHNRLEETGSGYDTLIPLVIESLELETARNVATALVFEKNGNVDNISHEEVEVVYGDLLASLKEFYIERQIRKLKKDMEGLSSAPRRDHDRERELTEEIYALERLKRELR
jgi:DNA primase